MKKHGLKDGQMAICIVPDWNVDGKFLEQTEYVIAVVDNGIFIDPRNPEITNFDNCVDGYLPLDESGCPLVKSYKHYN